MRVETPKLIPGAIVRATLPAQSDPAIPVMSRSAMHSARILVVDDDPLIVDLVRTALAADGYVRVDATTSPGEALARCRVELPDLLILDMMMPGLHGMDILAELRSLVPDDRYLPILVISGDRRARVKMEALVWGAKDYLPKPFDPAELVERVRRLLETQAVLSPPRESPPPRG